MTLDLFELSEQPFGAAPDPRFLYMGVPQRQALAALLQSLQAGRGLAIFIAKAGLGKTILLSHILHSFGDRVATVNILAAAQTPSDVVRAILAGLGVRDIAEDTDAMHSQLREMLLEERRLGKRVIVVIDEAQNLDAPVFALLGTLSDHESARGSLIQFILCGQPRLSEKLAGVKLLQSMQRGLIVRLEPLSAQDTAQYVDHRLRTAGYVREAPLFAPDAAALVARYGEGNPRIINSLCLECLSRAAAHQRERIGADIVREAAATLDLVKPGQESSPAPLRIASPPPQVVSPPSKPVAVPFVRPVPPPALPSPARSQQQAFRQEGLTERVAGSIEGRPAILMPALSEKPVPPPSAANVGEPWNDVAPLVAAQKMMSPDPAPGLQPLPALRQQKASETAPLPIASRPFRSEIGLLRARKGPPRNPQLIASLRRILVSKAGSSLATSLRRLRSLRSSEWPQDLRIALRPLATHQVSGLTAAAVFLLAVTGTVFGIYHARALRPPAEPMLAAAPLARAPVVPREQPRPMQSTASQVAPESSEHDLKGMDLATALRALSEKAQRQQQNRPEETRPQM